MLTEQRIRELLGQVADGKVAVDQALGTLRSLPFEDVGIGTLDHHRHLRPLHVHRAEGNVVRDQLLLPPENGLRQHPHPRIQLLDPLCHTLIAGLQDPAV